MTVSCPTTAVPTPVIGTVGELVALLEKERAPDVVPLFCGVNATLSEALCPAGIVMGKEVPLKTNWELLLVPAETVTLAPVALKVTD